MAKKSFKKSEQVLCDCYHSTSKDCATKILDTGFEKSMGEAQRYGDGVYFWEGVSDAPVFWLKKKKINDPAIIECHILLGVCFDFSNTYHKIVLEKAWDRLIKKLGSDDGICAEIVFNTIELICDIHIDTVRAIQISGRRDKLGTFEMINHQKIVCVRTISHILNANLVTESWE